MVLPKLSDFPPGTRFLVRYGDSPAVAEPGKLPFSWFGGKPNPLPTSFIEDGHMSPEVTFPEWLEVLKASIDSSISAKE